MHPLQVHSTNANFMAELHKGSFPNVQNDFSPVPFLQAYSSDVNLLHANIFLPNAKPLYAFHAGELLESTISPAASFDPGMQVRDSQSYRSNENSSLNHAMCPPFPDIVASRMGKMMSIDSTLYSYNLSKVLLEDFTIPRIEHSLPNARGEGVSISRNTKPEKSAEDSVSKKRKSDYSSQVMLQSKSIVVSKEARARRIISDRKRKAKVAEGFKALQNALPYSDKGSQVTVLGDVIDYIKFLKLRLNVLSQSRLSGEVSAYSFVHCEGYGHYLLHPHSDHELLEGYGHYLFHPHSEHELLEVKIGHLMQSNPQAANELLESKGLALAPLDAAYALLQHSRSVEVP